MKGKKDLRVYMSKDQYKWMVLAIAFGPILMLCEDELLSGIGRVLFILGLFFFGKYLWTAFRAENYVRKIEQEGKLDSVLQDFENAKPALECKLRFGEDYLFVRGSRAVICYDEVCQICPYASYKYTNQLLERGLAVKLNSGKVRLLPVYGFDDYFFKSPREEEVTLLREAIAIICSHNPEIHSVFEIYRL